MRWTWTLLHSSRKFVNKYLLKAADKSVATFMSSVLASSSFWFFSSSSSTYLVKTPCKWNLAQKKKLIREKTNLQYTAYPITSPCRRMIGYDTMGQIIVLLYVGNALFSTLFDRSKPSLWCDKIWGQPKSPRLTINLEIGGILTLSNIMMLLSLVWPWT